MDEQNHSQPAASEEEQTPETQPYVPRPKWQIAAAWFFLLVMVLAITGSPIDTDYENFRH